MRREAAIAGLAFVRDPRVAEVLLGAVTDNASGIRAQAARALGEQGDTSATAALTLALWDGSWGVRLEAIRALGTLRDATTSRVFQEIYSDPRTYLRSPSCVSHNSG